MRIILRWALFLLCLAGMIHAGLWFANHSGDVQMDVQGYRITTHLAVALGAIVGAVLTLHITYAAVMRLLTWRTRRTQKRSLRHYEQAINATAAYIVALGCRDMRAARTHSNALQRFLGNDAPLALLLKAHLAVKTQDDTAITQAFEALQAHPTTEVLAQHQLSLLAHQQGDAQRAWHLAREAYEAKPHLYDVAKHYFGMCLAHNDHQAAQPLLVHATRHHVFDASEAAHMRAMLSLRVYHMTGGEVALSHAFMHDMRFAPAFVYLDTLKAQGNVRKAWRLLSKAWKLQPHALLAQRVIEFTAHDKPEHRMKRAQSLHQMHPHHIESQLLMAQMALYARQWEQADHYVRMTEQYAPQQRVIALRAELVQRGYGQPWVAVIIPDPAWHCEVCGTHHEAWHTHCNHCHSFDSIVWGVMQSKPSDHASIAW